MMKADELPRLSSSITLILCTILSVFNRYVDVLITDVLLDH